MTNSNETYANSEIPGNGATTYVVEDRAGVVRQSDNPSLLLALEAVDFRARVVADLLCEPEAEPWSLLAAVAEYRVARAHARRTEVDAARRRS